MNIKFCSSILILSLTACGGGGSGSSGSGSSSAVLPAVQSAPSTKPTTAPSSAPSSAPSAAPSSAVVTSPTASPVIPFTITTGFFNSGTTENCITSSDGWTTNDATPTSNFIMPSQADLEIFKQTNFTCARIPIGSGASQDASYVAEANAYHTANIRVEGVISSADINNLPSSVVFAVSDEIEAGNELDNETNYQGTQGYVNAIAFVKAVAIAARQANSNILIISPGTSGYNPTYLAGIIPGLKGYIDCVGIHPYGTLPGNFGTLANNVKATYGIPVCYAEWGNTPGNQETPSGINTAYTLSQGSAGQFNFFNLGELENSSSEVSAL